MTGRYACLLLFAVLAAAQTVDQFHNQCYACIFSNAFFCDGDNECRQSRGSCSGSVWDITTGCPTTTMC